MWKTRPHDLLRLSATHVLASDAPSWVGIALDVTPWVVVRRVAAPTGRIAVGVRGTSRSERYAMEVDADDIGCSIAPEQLAHVASRPGRSLPAMHGLQTVRPLLNATGLPWGPTGSVGFELATGLPTVTPQSDLDLLIRVPRDAAEPLVLLAAMHRALSCVAVRVDCQVETPVGAVALAELVGGQSDVMVRTSEGPRLVRRALAMS